MCLRSVSRRTAWASRTGRRWVPRHPCARRSTRRARSSWSAAACRPATAGSRSRSRSQPFSMPCATSARAAAVGALTSASALRQARLAPGGEHLHHRRVAESQRVVGVVDRRVEALRRARPSAASDASLRKRSALSKSGFPDCPSGRTRPIEASTNGRSRLTCALMPSSRSPVPVIRWSRAASKAVCQAGRDRGAVAGLVVVVGVEVVLREHGVHVVDVRHVLEVAGDVPHVAVGLGDPRVGHREHRLVGAALRVLLQDRRRTS